MAEHGRTDRPAAGTGGTSERRLTWRGIVIAVTLVAGWMLPSSVSGAQTNGAQTRVCTQLQRVQERLANHPAARQALAARIQRLRCVGPTTTTVGQGTTTTTTHIDCPLPGGGVGPCPTTTVVPPGPTTVPPGSTSTVPTTLPPGASTTTTVGPGSGNTTSTVAPPTSAPGGPTTTGPPTTLGPCPTTTTGPGGTLPTTIPCLP